MQSLKRGLEIMEYIAQKKCASVSEISEAFGIHKSTASRILSTLAEGNLLYKSEETLKYYTSVGTLLYSSRTFENYMILDEIHPLLCALSEQTDMTAHLCALIQNKTYVIDQVRRKDKHYLKEPALPGMIEPLHSSAVGKCILAYLPPEESDLLIHAEPLTKYTEKTITDPEMLFEEIKRIRKNGYAVDDEEFSKGIFCLGVPIFDKTGRAFFSLSVSGDEDFLRNEKLLKTVLAQTRACASEIMKKYTVLDLT